MSGRMSGGSVVAAEQQGQCVKPNQVQERSFASSVADLMHDVMPQSSSTTVRAEPEKIDWVSFEYTDLNDASLKGYLESVVGNEVPMLVVLGLARGYQIWALMSNSDCEELLSDRQGPVKIVKVLPEPLPFSTKDSVRASPAYLVDQDRFPNARPLLAVCDSVTAVPGRQHCTLSISSLATGDLVHSLRFEEAISAVQVGKRAFVVSFPGRLVIYDALTFTEQFTLRGCYKSQELNTTPCALSGTWLAFADSKLSSMHQSCGGVSPGVEQLPAYASHVMSAAKNLSKTMSALGESVSTSLGGKPAHGGRGGKQNAGATVGFEPGILTVIDVAQFPNSQTDIHSSSSTSAVSVEGGGCSGGVVAHFPCLAEEPVASIFFSPNPSLLLTVGESGHYFHLFSLLPHPSASPMTALHHLYTLFRGTTPARVVDASFSLDTRWIALTTNHGTTHVFPITPYGGGINMRTHGGPKLVNRESQFYRSAGLDFLEAQGAVSTPPQLSTSPPSSGSPLANIGSHKGSPLSRELHPSLNKAHPSMAKVSGNPRLPPFPTPLTLTALGKIHQQLLGTLGNWAPDLSVHRGSTHKSNSANSGTCSRKLAVSFGRERGWNHKQGRHESGESLFVMNAENQLVEYSLRVHPQLPLPTAKVSEETPVLLSITPTAQWTLQRTKSSPDLRPPLSPKHPLVFSAAAARRRNSSAQSLRSATAVSSVVPHGDSHEELISAGLPATVLPSVDGLLCVQRKGQRSDVKKRSTLKQQNGGTSESGTPLWLSQVEMITYLGPSRRLWVGPQFTFRTFVDPAHSVTDLLAPHDSKTRGGGERSEPMAMPGLAGQRLSSLSSSSLSSTHGGHSPNPNLSLPHSYRSVPVVIEASSGSFDRKSNSVVTMEVCGSWSDNDFIACDEQEGRIRENIADAMRDAGGGGRKIEQRGKPALVLPTTINTQPILSSHKARTNEGLGGPLSCGTVSSGSRFRQESNGSASMEDARSVLSDSDEDDDTESREEDEDDFSRNLLFPDLDTL